MVLLVWREMFRDPVSRTPLAFLLCTGSDLWQKATAVPLICPFIQWLSFFWGGGSNHGHQHNLIRKPHPVDSHRVYLVEFIVYIFTIPLERMFTACLLLKVNFTEQKTSENIYSNPENQSPVT